MLFEYVERAESSSKIVRRGRWLYQGIVAFVGRFAGPIAAMVIVAVCIVQAALGTLPTRIYAIDLFIFLDGAWRVASGQTPHEDFFAGFGVLFWKPLQLALAVRGYDAEGIGLARAFYTAAIGLWTFLLVRKRLSPIQTLVVTLLSVAMTSAARPLGESVNMFSHAMFYNRVGYALLFIIVLDALYLRFLRSDVHGFRVFLGGMSTGMAIACLALLKVSFVVPAVLLLAAGVLLWSTTLRYLAGVLSGGVLIVVNAVTFLDFKLIPWASEMTQLAHARSGSLVGPILGVVSYEARTMGFVLIASICFVAFTSLRAADVVRYLLATIAVAGADVFCRSTNAQNADLPLLALWCVLGVLLVVAAPMQRSLGSSLPKYLIAAVSLALLYPLSLPFFGKEVLSFAGAAYVSAKTRSADIPRIDSGRLDSWATEEWHGHPMFLNSNGPRLVTITNDGLHLLSDLTRPDETIGSISFANRFSFALGRSPAPGGAAWIHAGNNFSVASPPPPEMLIGRPDVLMVQRYESPEGSMALLEIYRDHLESNYEVAGSSQYWTLHRRITEIERAP